MPKCETAAVYMTACQTVGCLSMYENWGVRISLRLGGRFGRVGKGCTRNGPETITDLIGEIQEGGLRKGLAAEILRIEAIS
jgi:hypothetical protein